ncbi:MAG: hypothetical protein U0271_04455 [Polyangiaceae bacterium]
MSLHDFFSDESKAAIRKAVADAERATSAEIAVRVERSSGDYRRADYLGGVAVAFLVLCFWLYSSTDFEYTYFPLELLGAFFVGYGLVRGTPGLRRSLAGRRSLERSVELAAKAGFVDLGVHRTRGRTGVLVFVSAFEQVAHVVCDVGVDREALGGAFADAVKKVLRSVSLDRDVTRFTSAIRELGAALGTALPRADDDENELPDGPTTSDEDSSDEDDEDEDDSPDSDAPQSNPRRGGRS